MRTSVRVHRCPVYSGTGSRLGLCCRHRQSWREPELRTVSALFLQKNEGAALLRRPRACAFAAPTFLLRQTAGACATSASSRRAARPCGRPRHPDDVSAIPIFRSIHVERERRLRMDASVALFPTSPQFSRPTEQPLTGISLANLAVVLAYVVAVAALGSLLGRRQKDASDYFLADRSVPWWAACFSIVATETSALTVISVPATAYGGGMWMLQLAAGYLLGRIAVSIFLLPRYFQGQLATAYTLLERRYATAIPLALITGLPTWQSILAIGVFTLVYSYYGGLRAVVWVDVAQMFIYIVGGIAVLWVLIGLVPGGWSGIARAAGEADKLRVIHP